MELITYIIEKMGLDEEVVDQHIADFNELQDAIVRLKRAKVDEAKYYTPSDEELVQYIAFKPKVIEEMV